MTNLILLADKMHNDQHANPGYGIGGIVLVCVIIWLLMSAGGGPPKKK